MLRFEHQKARSYIVKTLVKCSYRTRDLNGIVDNYENQNIVKFIGMLCLRILLRQTFIVQLNISISKIIRASD